MAEVIDLDARLGRLQSTVRAKQAVRNEQAQVTQSAKQARKAADWQTVQEHYPDHAQFISDFTAVFGKPASVKVTANSGDVILDSERYGA
jgi:hypothetical protein